MKKSEWNDEQIELMLSQMPMIKDNRNPRDIYQNISFQVKEKRKKTWVVPSIATAAAAILLLILAPAFMNDKTMDSSVSDSALGQRAKNADLATQAKNDSSKEMESVVTSEKDDQGKVSLFTAPEQQQYVISQVGDGEVLLTYGVMTKDAMFPTVVSFVAKSDGTDAVEQFEKNIPLVNEAIQNNDSWGLSPFPSTFFENFTEITSPDGIKKVRVDIPKDLHTESFTSGKIDAFKAAINGFRYIQPDYQHVELFKDGQQGVMIGETGEFIENIDVEKDTKNAYLYYLNKENGHKILVPIEDSYKTIEEAIEAMKNQVKQGQYILHKTITKSSIIQDVIPDGKNLIINFAEESSLADDDTFIIMVDAVMLTAKEFGFETVTFNGNIDKIGNVTFGQPEPVPLAPNPIN